MRFRVGRDPISSLHLCLLLQGDDNRIIAVASKLPYWPHLAHTGLVVDTLLGNLLWVDADWVVQVWR